MPGIASIVASSTANRTLALIDATKTVGGVNTTTYYPAGGAYSGNNIRSVCTTDGTGFWTGGTGSASNSGVRYLAFGSTTSAGTQLSTTPTNTRWVNIFDNQLYVSSSSSTFQYVLKVGTGIPTTNGQTISNLPGFPTSGGNSYSYVFLDRDPAVPGVDVVYIADQSLGLVKYSFNGTTWTSRGSLSGNATGLTGFYNCTNNNVELYLKVRLLICYLLFFVPIPLGTI
jgi:hypothetical protein